MSEAGSMMLSMGIERYTICTIFIRLYGVVISVTPMLRAMSMM